MCVLECVSTHFAISIHTIFQDTPHETFQDIHFNTPISRHSFQDTHIPRHMIQDRESNMHIPRHTRKQNRETEMPSLTESARIKDLQEGRLPNTTSQMLGAANPVLSGSACLGQAMSCPDLPASGKPGSGISFLDKLGTPRLVTMPFLFLGRAVVSAIAAAWLTV